MTALRLQHLVPATLVLAVAAIVAWLSFTQDPAEAFLFPRLISVVFAALAVWNFLRAVLGLSRIGGGLSREVMSSIAPGLAVMLVFVFFVARELGFYASSALAFMTVYSIYDPAPLGSARAWLKRLIVSIGFMIVIYALFALLLKVQTPRGILM